MEEMQEGLHLNNNYKLRIYSSKYVMGALLSVSFCYKLT